MTRRPPRVPTAAAVAQAIDLPIERWTGNCFAVASKAVDAKLVAGTAVYGHWRGPIDRAACDGLGCPRPVGLAIVDVDLSVPPACSRPAHWTTVVAYAKVRSMSNADATPTEAAPHSPPYLVIMAKYGKDA